MKIIFVSDAVFPYMKGGKEKRLYEISTRLSKMGHDVHVYTMHWWDTPEKTKVENGIILHAISKRYDMYYENRRSIKEGVLFGVSCLKLFGTKFDIIDVDHMPFFPILAVWFVCVVTGRKNKFYGTWHEALTKEEWVNYMGKMGMIASFIENICIHLPSRITATSEQTKSHLEEKIDPNRVRLVTPGVDFDLINSVGSSGSKYDVISICRLVKDKNIDLLIRSIAAAKKQEPNITCLIIGKGPEKNQLLKLTKKLELENNMTFIESISENSEVYKQIKSAKVFCLPSTREGFGIVVLEALGCGVPVITSDLPTNASRRLVTNGVNGSLVKLNKNLLAKEIIYWIKKRFEKSNYLLADIAKYDWEELAYSQYEVYMI